MAVRTIIFSAYGAVLLCAVIAPAIPQIIPSSDKVPSATERTQERSGAIRLAQNGDADRDDDEDDEDVPPLPERSPPPSLRDPKVYTEPLGPPPPPSAARNDDNDDDDDDDEDRNETAAGDGLNEPPLVPERAVPPSLRNPRVYAEPLGPPPASQSARREDRDEHEDDDDDDDDRPSTADRPVQQPSETAVDEGENGIPPLPQRAIPPSLRNPRVYAEPIGPPAPPETWSQDEIADAQTQCKAVLGESDFDFKGLPPIREGACGTPAPVQLKGLTREVKVDLHPPATMTCPLASAVGRWMSEVVQPRAKALLETDIVQIANISAYVCRSRYNDSTQRISYHAFAEAVDIAGFVTAKGETITVLEHWPGTDKRAQFLKEIHDGACKIFGTVLGPDANAAHRNHFHLDLAKRRHSAYCH
jgi:hypothetical protein